VSDYDFRFGGLGRLYGADALIRLKRAHVAVIGIGGVGSWAVEALARSGVGALTLVDLDEVCVSNVNRQLPAVEETIGRSKVEAMTDRVRSIHPGCQVHPLIEFLTESSTDRILDEFQARRGLWIIDAIDSSPNKCRLVLGCRKRNLRLVISGAAGGRQDPTRIRITDLAEVTHDRLLADLRGRLRRESAFDSSRKRWGLPTVHSPEPPQKPLLNKTSCDSGSPASMEVVSPPRMNCQHGYGSAAFVTGAFGFAAAGHVIQQVCQAS
jgi:tRNA A37 threonylcarbamoyladenosine dehydratase